MVLPVPPFVLLAQLWRRAPPILAIESSLTRISTSFEGFSWRSTLSERDLVKLRSNFRIPNSVKLSIPVARCTDEEGYAGDAALTGVDKLAAWIVGEHAKFEK
ncbi:hypothetical protein F2P56_007431, partial [Juglans regia]